MKERKRKPQVAFDCVMQLWPVPFDKTDLTVKEGFEVKENQRLPECQ